MENLDEQLSSHQVISQNAVDDIKSTTPWIKFLAVLGFIYSGILIILTLVFLGGGIAAGNMGTLVAGLIFAAFTALHFYIVLNLFQYASLLKEFTFAQDVQRLEKALVKQKMFWMIIGILTLVLIIIYALALILLGSQIAVMMNSFMQSFPRH